MKFATSHNVLVIGNDRESVENQINNIQKEVGPTGSVVFVESYKVSRELVGKDNVYDGVVSISATSHNESVFSELVKVLKPGGSLFIREPSLSAISPNTTNPFRTDKDIFLKLTIAGLVDIQTKLESPQPEELNRIIVPLNGLAESLKNNISVLEVVSSKPDWNIGAKKVCDCLQRN